MDEMKSTRDLIEDVERGFYMKLKETDVDDPNWQKLINGGKTISDIRNATDTAENNRLNNNVRNDIEEQKLIIEAERLKVDKQRNIITVLAILGFSGLNIWSTLKSYNMDNEFTCYRAMKDVAKDCIKSIGGIFKWR